MFDVKISLLFLLCENVALWVPLIAARTAEVPVEEEERTERDGIDPEAQKGVGKLVHQFSLSCLDGNFALFLVIGKKSIVAGRGPAPPRNLPGLLLKPKISDMIEEGRNHPSLPP